MGIELPSPFAQTSGAPGHNGEKNGHAGSFASSVPEFGAPLSPEAYGRQNVENNASNYEPLKEVVNGAGAGENNGQPVRSVVSDATIVPQQVTTSASAVLDDVPVVAADEDLIEKVWVDAVKGAISRTPGDPYARSEAIGKLQADYLQKRYGKIVGEA